MRRRVDLRRTVVVLRVEVRGGVLLSAGERCALDLRPPEHPLLVADDVGVPGLDVHPDLPHHLVAAPGHPPGVAVEPDEPVVVGVGRDVPGAVLEPHQVAGRALVRPRRRAAEAEHGPADGRGATGHPCQVAHRVVRHLGVVGAGLQGQVTAAQPLLQVVARQRRDVGERRRAPVGQPEALVEDAGAEAHRHGQGRRPEVERLARVGADPVAVRRFDAADGLAGLQLGDRGRPPGEEHLQLGRDGRRQVERHVDAVALRGGADPALWLPCRGGVERLALRQVDRLVAVRRRRERVHAGRRGGAADARCRADPGTGHREAGAEQSAAGDVRPGCLVRLGHAVATFSARRDSGSWSAWICCEIVFASDCLVAASQLAKPPRSSASR